MVVRFVIFRLYGVGLGFGNPNLNLNYSMIILILEPPSKNTSFIVFFLLGLSIAITTIPNSSTKEPTCLSVVVLFTF